MASSTHTENLVIPKHLCSKLKLGDNNISNFPSNNQQENIDIKIRCINHENYETDIGEDWLEDKFVCDENIIERILEEAEYRSLINEEFIGYFLLINNEIYASLIMTHDINDNIQKILDKLEPVIDKKECIELSLLCRDSTHGWKTRWPTETMKYVTSMFVNCVLSNIHSNLSLSTKSNPNVKYVVLYTAKNNVNKLIDYYTKFGFERIMKSNVMIKELETIQNAGRKFKYKRKTINRKKNKKRKRITCKRITCKRITCKRITGKRKTG